MGNRAEELRRQTIAGGGAMVGHSMNQRVLKGMKERQQKYPRPMDKVVRTESRTRRIERSQREFEELKEKVSALEDQHKGLEFLGERKKFQLARVLQDVGEKKATPQQMDFIDRHGQEKEYYITNKGNQVTITIADFTRPVV